MNARAKPEMQGRGRLLLLVCVLLSEPPFRPPREEAAEENLWHLASAGNREEGRRGNGGGEEGGKSWVRYERDGRPARVAGSQPEIPRISIRDASVRVRQIPDARVVEGSQFYRTSQGPRSCVQASSRVA